MTAYNFWSVLQYALMRNVQASSAPQTSPENTTMYMEWYRELQSCNPLPQIISTRFSIVLNPSIVDKKIMIQVNHILGKAT